ncbi:hypothetical protein JR316_0002259 [Psilocybe cubensis]|uniref:Uncharacterized protein n=2 Tax=Psilocybe cubensis TaxID=181762 RepID=A0ACB8HD00_PSICU|nr:hypothetical protein JR316_0002259 [Psilocybe cubensis]KAH9485351.1 hypothetical protein JR316_0002259 [Psilocybe cubensis]
MSPSKRKVESSVNPPNKKLKDSHVSDGEFKLVQASLVLSIPPVFAANPAAGANELLDSMIMRCAMVHKI